MGNCLHADASGHERRLSVAHDHMNLYSGLTWIQASDILARKYEVICELGRGGVGEVHLVQMKPEFIRPSLTVDGSCSSETSRKGSNSTSTSAHSSNGTATPSSGRERARRLSIGVESPTAATSTNISSNGQFSPLISTVRQFAMKTVYLDRVPRQRYGELEHEVLVLKQLDHPNIIRCREVFLYDEKICMILDLCQGGTLRGVQFNELDTWIVVTQILRALKYLHYTCGIAHRDLKLENIMLESKTKHLHVRLVDFGLSSAFCIGKKLTGAGGTPYSMAPELILEGEGFTERTDMWSVGVITYMLLGRSCPFLRNANDLGDTEYMDKFSLASYSMDDAIWVNVSEHPKKLIENLFVRSPESRWDACKCLDFCEKEWRGGADLSLGSERESFLSVDTNRTFSFHDICTSMRRFSSYSKLKKAALMIAAFSSPTEEIMILREAFLEINADKTGHIKLQVMECDDNVLNALLACGSPPVLLTLLPS